MFKVKEQNLKGENHRPETIIKLLNFLDYAHMYTCMSFIDSNVSFLQLHLYIYHVSYRYMLFIFFVFSSFLFSLLNIFHMYGG